MRRLSLALATVFGMSACSVCAAGLVGDEFSTQAWPGRMPDAEMKKVEPLVKEVETAMLAADRDGVVAVVAKLRSALGSYAGVPESKPEYVVPIDDSMPDLDKVMKLWRGSFDRLRGRNAWDRAAPLDANQQTGDRLRVSLRAVRAYLQSYEAGLEGRDDLRDLALVGANYMAACQGSNGCFGYPYQVGGSGLKRGAAEMVQKAVASGKSLDEMVENGWIINVFNLGGGGLQFDNGMVGIGLLYVYAETGDTKYLEAARSAGEWALRQPIVRNWNYNCFSGYVLARLYRVTGETRFLDAARDKFEVGVLPGQMESGRWVDQHNAKIQYHSVMLRSLIDYHLALRQAGDDPNAERVKKHITLGLDNVSEQIATYGASNIHEMLSLDALCLGLLVFGDNGAWVNAANICVNAACDAALPMLEARGMPMTATVATYVLYRKVREGQAKAREVETRLGISQ